MKNISVYFFTTLILCGITYFVASYDNKKSTAIVAAQTISPAADQHGLLEKLQSLEQENSLLKNQLEVLRKKRAENKQNINNDDKGSEKVNLGDLSGASYEEQFNILKRADDFSKYIKNLQQEKSTMFNDLNAKFNSEVVDYDWAPGYQKKIEKIFSENEKLNQFSPNAIECRTNKCQIQIHVTDNEEANMLTQAFSEAVHANNANINKTEVVATPDFAQGILNLYIAKDNNVKTYE